MNLTLRRAIGVIFLASVWGQVGCQSEPEQDNTPLLAEARADESNFSPAVSKNPYKEVAKNLLERTVFETAGPAGTRIELRDVFVAPGAKAENVSLPGSAVLQVLSGEGSLSTGGKSEELSMGKAVSLAQNTSCALESRGITPLVLRAHLVIPQ